MGAAAVSESDAQQMKRRGVNAVHGPPRQLAAFKDAARDMVLSASPAVKFPIPYFLRPKVRSVHVCKRVMDAAAQNAGSLLGLGHTHTHTRAHTHTRLD